MPRGTTVTHAKSCTLLGKGESDFTLYLPFPTSPAPNGQMWLCKKLITDGGWKKKRTPPPTPTTRLFPLQTWGWMGRPGKTGRWKTHYRCEVWRIRLKDNLRVVNFNFGGLNALLSNTKQIGNKKPHERERERRLNILKSLLELKTALPETWGAAIQQLQSSKKENEDCNLISTPKCT